jgi:hypothetical protein
MMTVKEIHDACYKAASTGIHFQGIAFSEKNGIGFKYEPTMHYWASVNVLWKSGYHEYLSKEVKEEFSKYVATLGWRVLTWW